MRTTTGRITFTHTNENAGTICEYQIEYRVTSGTPPVWYYPDGSGDPGTPDECELIDAVCVSFTDATTYNGKPSPQDGISMGRNFLMNLLSDEDREHIEELCIEDAAERYGY